MREEQRLRVPENRVVRNIFGPKRDEEKGYWRRQHNEEFHDLYPSLNITRVIKSRMRWAGTLARMGEEERYVQDFSRVNHRGRPYGTVTHVLCGNNTPHSNMIGTQSINFYFILLC